MILMQFFFNEKTPKICVRKEIENIINSYLKKPKPKIQQKKTKLFFSFYFIAS